MGTDSIFLNFYLKITMIALLFAVVCVPYASAEGILSLEFPNGIEKRSLGSCASSNPCSSGQTCCDTTQGEGCCPQANACCCPDKQHCCPNGKCQCTGCPGASCACSDCTLSGGQ